VLLRRSTYSLRLRRLLRCTLPPSQAATLGRALSSAGYDGLMERSYDDNGNPSFEICHCCGYQFGYDDGSEGIGHSEYRSNWLTSGAKWFRANRKPAEWDIEVQLARLRSQS
jgi:hypothetical protein